MLNEKDIVIEYYKGKGPGGQHKNKVATACRVTHIPTNIVVCIDGRKREQNRKKALKELENRVYSLQEQHKAAEKKERRDKAIKTRDIIRTYDYKHDTVIDHRSGKSASIKEVVKKGNIDKLR